MGDGGADLADGGADFAADDALDLAEDGLAEPGLAERWSSVKWMESLAGVNLELPQSWTMRRSPDSEATLFRLSSEWGEYHCHAGGALLIQLCRLVWTLYIL